MSKSKAIYGEFSNAGSEQLYVDNKSLLSADPIKEDFVYNNDTEFYLFFSS